MELIYAILIFFGAMSPDQYTPYSQTAYIETISSQQTLIQTISADADLVERIRTMDIDRLED